MKTNKILIILAVIIVIVLAIYLAMSGGKKGTVQPSPTPTLTATATPNPNGSVSCSDFQCIHDNFLTCTPAELKVVPSGSTSTAIISVLGKEQANCHFKIDIDGHGGNCLFSSANLNDNVLNQIFGNETGQSQVLNQSCTSF